nr:hypothetical protein [uncultured Campylobacter sp.]
MDGIIIFADDDVLKDNQPENKLFKKFVKDGGFPVLPITNILDLEKAIDSISTFRVLILDWEFKKNIGIDEDAGARLPNDTPLDMLLKKDIYSLIYIYSRNPDKIRNNEELKVKFGDKIKIEDKKGDDGDVDKEFEKIQKGISDFEEKHLFMEIPFVWSQAINRSVQNIFFELEQADINWIKEIKKKASNDVLEIIGIFHNILDESLIQNELLINELNKIITDESELDGEKAAKLYQRIFYSKLNDNAPIMTGDIFKFNENEYGILITPECDIARDDYQGKYDFLIIDKCESEAFQKRTNDKKIFNNGSLSKHILPSFPFYENNIILINKLALIDFKISHIISRRSKTDLLKLKRKYKLNSPYIQQLRQRYIAFFGRYGVPDIPNSLRIYNLENIK